MANLSSYVQKIMANADSEEKRIWSYISPHLFERGVPHPRLRSRDLFRYALILCERETAKPTPDLQRLTDVIKLAEKIQFPGGQFKWFWKDHQLRDLNAVEFCMRDAAIIYDYQTHIQKLPDNLWSRFQRVVRSALKACKRHQVPEKYTNIALLNCLNLLMLGHLLPDTEALYLGEERFLRLYYYTWDWGLHENNRVGYTQIQQDVLELLQSKVLDKKIQDAASALYAICEHGYNLNTPNSNQPRSALFLDFPVFIMPRYKSIHYNKSPNNNFASLFSSASSLPRYIKEHWGSAFNESLTHYITEDITLGTLASCYDWPPAKDTPLAVNLISLLPQNTSIQRAGQDPVSVYYPEVCYLITGVKPDFGS